MNTVVVIEMDESALKWTKGHAAGDRLVGVAGDASDPATTRSAADGAEKAGRLRGWVNNAAVFRDAAVHASPQQVVDLIGLNLKPAVVGSGTAIERFLSHGEGGAIVNVSSHQATRAVRGALPYATAKAAIEGLTRALAVDYGPHGVRTNAVALGSITTERSDEFVGRQTTTEAARIQEEMRRLHPLGRMGTSAEVAAAVAFLLSNEASFINGAIIPIDGGRSAMGLDSESREVDGGP